MERACGPHDACAPMAPRLPVLSHVRRQVCLCVVAGPRRFMPNKAEFPDYEEAADKHEAWEVA